MTRNELKQMVIEFIEFYAITLAVLVLGLLAIALVVVITGWVPGAQ